MALGIIRDRLFEEVTSTMAGAFVDFCGTIRVDYDSYALTAAKEHNAAAAV